jgi:NAD(P)-dependent dehydrogenase (short-subunit alcohol dehydrogenase family)
MPSNHRHAVTDLLSLRGKVALITGAGGHLGSAMAEALAEGGASVIASSRTLASAEAIAAKLPRIDGALHNAVAIDHMDESSIQSGFAAAVKKAGRVDVLINNGHEALGSDWTTVTGEQFTRQLSNATGYFLLARAFHDHAVSRGGGGAIVMIGSMYGLVGSYPDAYTDIAPASPVAYHALKGGIIQMTRHLAVYWAKDGIRVNCLSPGPFPDDKASPELVERLSQKSPMKRMGRPGELKGPVVFLASEASSYITGHNLVIDGGWTAW